MVTLPKISRVLSRCDLCHVPSLSTRSDHTAEESSSTADPRVGFTVCGAIGRNVPVDGAAARSR